MPPPPRVLLLTPAIPPDTVTGATRAARIHRFLPEFGFEVDVIAEGPASSSLPGVLRVGRRPGDAPAPHLSRLAALVKRLLAHDDQLAFSAHVYAAAAEQARHRGYSAILSTAPPMGLHLSALSLKRRCGIPAVCDFRDPLVGNPFRVPQGLINYDRWLESFIARNADAVICNTDAALDQFRLRHPRHAARCHLVWNGFEPEDRTAPPPPASGPVRVIAHVGTLYGGRDPSAVLNSLGRLTASGRLQPGSFLLRLAGPILPEMARRLGDTFEPLVRQRLLEVDNRDIPRAEAQALANSAACSFIVDINDSQVAVQVPAKLYPAILLGRPVLALTYEGSPTSNVLARSGVPACCLDPRWAPARIDDALEQFLHLPTAITPPNEWFLENFDGRRQVAAIAHILESAMRRGTLANAPR